MRAAVINGEAITLNDDTYPNTAAMVSDLNGTDGLTIVPMSLPGIGADPVNPNLNAGEVGVQVFDNGNAIMYCTQNGEMSHCVGSSAAEGVSPLVVSDGNFSSASAEDLRLVVCAMGYLLMGQQLGGCPASGDPVYLYIVLGWFGGSNTTIPSDGDTGGTPGQLEALTASYDAVNDVVTLTSPSGQFGSTTDYVYVQSSGIGGSDMYGGAQYAAAGFDEEFQVVNANTITITGKRDAQYPEFKGFIRMLEVSNGSYDDYTVAPIGRYYGVLDVSLPAKPAGSTLTSPAANTLRIAGVRFISAPDGAVAGIIVHSPDSGTTWNYSVNDQNVTVTDDAITIVDPALDGMRISQAQLTGPAGAVGVSHPTTYQSGETYFS